MERNDVERRVLEAVGRALGFFSMLRPADRQFRDFLPGLHRRHPRVPESITDALANVNPYTLFDPRPASAAAPDPDEARA